ncbi:MAG: hypothetical protein B7733_05930 [Myxococcales bacterium FL481]|nr:MAG: hypothetical protein B7733_05930 [Myxococcales bacterium FL481]
MVQIPQTDYAGAQKVGFAGQLVSRPEHSVIASRYCATELGFGEGVLREATDAQTVELPSGTFAAGLFEGVVLKHAQHNSATTKDVDEDEFFSCLREGQCWVIVEDAVSRGDQLFLRHTANGGNDPGGFRSDADTNRAVQVPVHVMQDAAAGAPCLVEVRRA